MELPVPPNLLCFVVKNHAFSDGNKRIAAALFIAFLAGNKALCRKDGTKRIADNALVAITLMIANFLSKTEMRTTVYTFKPGRYEWTGRKV